MSRVPFGGSGATWVVDVTKSRTKKEDCTEALEGEHPWSAHSIGRPSAACRGHLRLLLRLPRPWPIGMRSVGDDAAQYAMPTRWLSISCCVTGVARKACERYPMGCTGTGKVRGSGLVGSGHRAVEVLKRLDACASSGWLGNVVEQVPTKITYRRVVLYSTVLYTYVQGQLAGSSVSGWAGADGECLSVPRLNGA